MIIETNFHLNAPEHRQFSTICNFLSKVNLQYRSNSFTFLGKDMIFDNFFANELLNNLLKEFKNKKEIKIVTICWDSSNPNELNLKKFKRKNKNKFMKIKFKPQSEIDLSKVFPLVSIEEYTLIEDTEILITNKEYEEALKNKYLKLADYKISIDLIEVINEKGISAEQEKIQAVADSKFIYSEDVVDVLMAGIELNKNVILYGRGGHAKSELTTLVLDELVKSGRLKSRPFVQAFGDGLTEDRLFGGMDIIKYKEEGKIEYLLDNSFLNHEIVVFEEIFDAPANVLLALKDIMTSGYYRNGNEQYKCKTKVFIGLTNKSKKDFGEDSDSLKALAERFPLTLKVEWNNYSKSSFIKLFQKVLGQPFYEKHTEELSTIADIISMNNINGTSFVSPRTAIYAAQVYCSGRKLEYISEIDPNILRDYYNKKTETKFDSKQKKLIEKINAYIDAHDLEEIDNSDQFIQELDKIRQLAGEPPLGNIVDNSHSKMQKLSKAKYIFNIINHISFTQSNVQESTKLNKKIKLVMDTITKSLDEDKNNNTVSEENSASDQNL